MQNKCTRKICAFNIFELENEEKCMEHNNNSFISGADKKSANELLSNSRKSNGQTYKNIAVKMRSDRKNKKGKLIKEKFAKLYSLYESCYFLCMFKLNAKEVRNFFKNHNFSSKNGIKSLNDIICIYDEECLVELKNSWLFSLDKRIELHKKLFNFLKYIENCSK